MWGQKIQQLKEAMNKILEQLKEEDSFNLVEFNSNARIWDINNHSASVWYPSSNNWYYSEEPKAETISLLNGTFPRAYSANADNIKKAKDAINKLNSDGSTDMYKGLEVGLHLIEVERTDKDNKIKRQPIVVFLTDGDPTDYGTEYITNKISEFNSGPRKAPIFALSFGEGADKDFLKKLSLRNSGFSRHIYEAADASLQLQDFYKQISSPLLSDVTFKYEPTVTSLTKTDFPIHFGGSEIVVAGWCGNVPSNSAVCTVTTFPSIDGVGRDGVVSLKPVASNTISNIERLWAYLTISQMLEKKEESKDKEDELKKKALDLALKYEFVTPVSSLVVVKPNDTNAVDTEQASQQKGQYGFPQSAFGLTTPFIPGMPGPIFSNSFSAQSMSGGYFPALESDVDALFEISYTTTSEVLMTSLKPTTLETLMDILPWLKDILSNDIVQAPTGKYKLGLNETISEIVTCSKTPLNQEGHCSLLHECTQVHSLLQKADDFFNHICVLKNEFAGVCCPNDP
ncbi:hypothetical protein FQR65_LT06675 [Abscondita terminalis]|nr:hypothetical protein FQR65_LT06675 [Abscondita terminalis]